MPADPVTPIRNVQRLNFKDTSLQKLQDGLVGAINPFMREVAERLNVSDRLVPVPSSVSSPGVLGDYAVSATHLYVCVATNTWRRVALSTW